MKRLLFILITVLFVGSSWAQQPGERLSPLTKNSSIQSVEKRSLRAGGADSTFIYLADTISLPFLDDFSTDRFKKFNASATDTNVSDTVFYRLYDQSNTTVLPDTARFMLDTTYNIVYDSVTTDSLAISYIPLTHDTIWNHNIDDYPITETEIEVWPRYDIIDTVWTGTTDTVYRTPDISQDSSRVFFVRKGADQSIWSTTSTYRNDRYAIMPPSVGTATFDGLDSTGYPYNFNGTFAPYGVADVLMSKPIDLSSVSDSLYLTFYYQSTGRGNEPDPEDSLVLEFWSPVQGTWKHVWSTPGEPLDTFKVVHLLVEDPIFKANGFKFRIYNYADLSGALDHWHIDYVYLDEFRSYDDYIMNDLAFVYPGKSLLNQYTAMPWKHFKWDPAGNMKDTTNLWISNNSDFTKNLFNRSEEIDFEGVTQASFSFAPTVPNINAFTHQTTSFEVNSGSTNFVYDTSLADTCARFKVRHIIETTTFPELLNTNDTVEFEQVFENYYAYDDGTAEAAYGTFGGNSKVAYKFSIPQGDSIRGVLMHWEPSVNNVSNETFWLTVWGNSGGEPGSVIHESNQLPFHKPIYVDSVNGFAHYFFDNEERVFVNGTFYVGWQQQGQTPLNIGMDLNNDRSNKIYYNVNGTWNSTSFPGALMIRPIFVSEKDNLMTIESEESPEFHFYPNPSSGLIQITPLDRLHTVDLHVLDLSGRVIHQARNFTGGSIDLSSHSNGVYLIRLTDPKTGMSGIKKLVIRH